MLPATIYRRTKHIISPIKVERQHAEQGKAKLREMPAEKRAELEDQESGSIEMCPDEVVNSSAPRFLFTLASGRGSIVGHTESWSVAIKNGTYSTETPTLVSCLISQRGFGPPVLSGRRAKRTF